MKRFIIIALLIAFGVSAIAQTSGYDYKKNRRTGLWDMVIDINQTFDSLQANVIVTDTLVLAADTITNIVYTDSITTNLANTTTGIPVAHIDTLYQSGTATVRIAISLADDETYNLPDAKNINLEVTQGANFAKYIIIADGTVAMPITLNSTDDDDTDGVTICVYDGGGTQAIVKNRSGGALTFLIQYTWEY